MRSTVGGGLQLSAELGEAATKTVSQGEGATLRGELRGVGGDIAGAPLCVFSRVATDSGRDFLGIAISGSRGDYRFAVAPGPSRELIAVYRPGQRQMQSDSEPLFLQSCRRAAKRRGKARCRKARGVKGKGAKARRGRKPPPASRARR